MAGSAFHTHGTSILICILIELSLKEISHIPKDTFNFVERREKDLEIGTVLGVAGLKIYTKMFQLI